MIEIRRVLCPIDFSDFSRRALDHAVAIAKWYKSTITVMHVRPILAPAAYAPGSSALSSTALTPKERDDLLASMKRFAEAEAGSTVPIEFELYEGNTAGAILAKADEMHCDMLVMGTHGRSGFEHLVLGSVTEKVLRRAGCPVLSVPRLAADAVPAPPVLFRRIVCAIDFSECSMHALDYALSLAQEANAQLLVVHVIEVPPDLPPDVHETILGGPHSLREYIAAAEEDRRGRLQDAIPEHMRMRGAVETVLATGKAYREILHVAAEREGDLIVIGTHSGVAHRLFFGSTAQHVVRQASVPVLTLRAG